MSKKLKFESVEKFYPDLKEFVKADSDYERKALNTEMEVEDDGIIDAVFSSINVDRDRDVILPDAVDYSFYSGVVMFNHELSSLPIGRATEIKILKDKVIGRIKIAEGYEFAKNCLTLIRQKCLTGISIGFLPKEILIAGTKAFRDACTKYGINAEGVDRIISKLELIEVSVVPVPSNRQSIIGAVAAKSITADDRTNKAFGLDKPEVIEQLNYASKLIETQKALEATTKALQSLETKAAKDTVVDPASLTWQAYAKILGKQESNLVNALNSTWSTAQNQVASIDTTKPIDQIATELDSILVGASTQADSLTRTEVERIANQVFAGYRTGYDGMTPIKDIEQVDKWRNQFVEDYMLKLQPQTDKPIANQSIEDFKNKFLRSITENTEKPVLSMEESNQASSNLTVFGAQKEFIANLINEAGSGDLIQIRGLEDEKLCEVCRPALDQLYSVGGKSENFPSLDSLKASGWGHINCRCVTIPVATPEMPKTEEEKAVEVTATKAVVEETIKVVDVPVKVITVKVIQKSVKPIDKDALQAKALALAKGKLVFMD